MVGYVRIDRLSGRASLGGRDPVPVLALRGRGLVVGWRHKRDDQDLVRVSFTYEVGRHVFAKHPEPPLHELRKVTNSPPRLCT